MKVAGCFKREKEKGKRKKKKEMKRKIYKGFHKILAGIFVLSLVMTSIQVPTLVAAGEKKERKNW